MFPLYENRTNSVKTASWVRSMGLPNGVSSALSVNSGAIFSIEIKWNDCDAVTGSRFTLFTRFGECSFLPIGRAPLSTPLGFISGETSPSVRTLSLLRCPYHGSYTLDNTELSDPISL